MMTNAPRRGRPKSIDREAVVQRAMGHLWAEGLHGASSINDLCQRIDISKPGLYREFGGEDGLLHAALELYRAQAVLPLLELISADLSFFETVDRGLFALTQPGARPPGCLFTRMRLDRGRLGPQTEERLKEIEAERLQAFEAFFVRALSRGEVNATLSAAFAASYLDAQLTLVLTQMALGASGDEVRQQARIALGALTAGPPSSL